MREPIIKDNNIDFEYIEFLSPSECRTYRGKPFTGTLLEEDGKSYTEKKYSIDKDKGLDIFHKLAKYNSSRITNTANYLLKKLHEKAFATEEYINNLHINIKLIE